MLTQALVGVGLNRIFPFLLFFLFLEFLWFSNVLVHIRSFCGAVHQRVSKLKMPGRLTSVYHKLGALWIK